MKFILIIFLFLSFILIAQNKTYWADSTKKFSGEDTIKQLKIKKLPDSISHKSILELKTIINGQHFKVERLRNFLEQPPDNEFFTKEEIASGLSKNQLIAYKKNKEILLGILQKKYEECWWYRVKSLGQLIGLPDWIIQTLMFGLLFF